MRYAFIAAQEKAHRLGMMCRVLKVSRSGYYAWRDRPESNRAMGDRRLLEKIREIHAGSRKTYGSPRIHRELKNRGERCGNRRVEKLMRTGGISAQEKRKFVVTTDSRHGLPVAENILDRRFEVSEPDRVWMSDITYIPTREGWLYLAGVLDLCTKRAVGWSMSDSLENSLVLEALRMACSRRRPRAGMIHHSDRGGQYASHEYRTVLKDNGIEASMSRKGDCWDNAPMESFFGTLKRELIHRRDYRTRDEAKMDIFEYVEVFYNRQRMHSSLGYLSPADYEERIAEKTG